MEEGERRLGWIKSLERQVCHDRGILAYGVQHHRFFEFRSHFADDVNTLRFELLEVGQVV